MRKGKTKKEREESEKETVSNSQEEIGERRIMKRILTAMEYSIEKNTVGDFFVFIYCTLSCLYVWVYALVYLFFEIDFHSIQLMNLL